MAELESLSNKELRQKCIEFGMPNVPVTDSSRKILIRRLEAAMLGKPLTTTPAKTNRRETVHVSKPSEVASSPKITASKKLNNNRPSRRTVALPDRHAVITTTVSEPENSDFSPDRVEQEPIKRATKTPEKPQNLYPKLPVKEPSPKPQILSKTGVVTTSYVQETIPINKSYDVDVDDVVDLVDSIDEEIDKSTTKDPQPINYVRDAEPIFTTTAPLTSTLTSNTRYRSMDAYSYNKPNYLSSTNVRKTYIAPNSGYNVPEETSSYPRPYESMEDEEEEYEEDDEVVFIKESPIKDAETPFLSQFARNLENLKATPIRHSVGPTKISPPKGILRNRENIYSRHTIGNPLLNINSRRSMNRTNESSFRQYIMSLEEKYHLKHSLILISIFILAVFIYVFFIQSV